MFFEAWFELNEEREISPERNTVLRIKREQVDSWCRWHGLRIDVDFKHVLWQIVVAMDNAYIPLEIKKIEKRIKAENSKAKREERRRSRGANAKRFR